MTDQGAPSQAASTPSQAARPKPVIAATPVKAVEPVRAADPVQAEGRRHSAKWTGRLMVFLRIMAVLSMAKGLYHWAIVCGIGGPAEGFEYQPTPWQTATIFFAVIDLVAAVGLWLAAAWGAVVWLTAGVSMAAVEVFFPQVYGGRPIVVGTEAVLLFSYLFLAIQSAREHPN
jgi:hypothetical protein